VEYAIKSGPWAIGTKIKCVKDPANGYSNIRAGHTGIVSEGKVSHGCSKIIRINNSKKIYTFALEDMHCYKKVSDANEWCGQHRVRMRGVYASRK